MRLAGIGAESGLVGRVIGCRATDGTADLLAPLALHVVTVVDGTVSAAKVVVVVVVGLPADGGAGNTRGTHLRRGIVLLVEGQFWVVRWEYGPELALMILRLIFERRFRNRAAARSSDLHGLWLWLWLRQRLRLDAQWRSGRRRCHRVWKAVPLEVVVLRRCWRLVDNA